MASRALFRKRCAQRDPPAYCEHALARGCGFHRASILTPAGVSSAVPFSTEFHVNIAFLCIAVACVMPYVLVILSKSGGHRAAKPYDNNEPRVWLADLEGWPRRANAAQQNSWEALPVFIAAVLMASHAGVAQATLDFWAVWFVVARVLYAACYIANWASLRSLVWAIAMLGPLRLIVAAL